MTRIDYSTDFLAFYRDMYVVEGAYGPHPVIPAFLSTWLKAAFPEPTGSPAARNIGDFRTKKEGKSALAGGVGLYMASRKKYQEVVICAADQDQSRDRILRSIKFACDNGPLSSHAKVYKDVIELDNHSLITALPNDWQGAAGGNFSAVLFDEMHSWIYENQRRLFDELVIPPTQPGGVRWIASYAGWEGESLLLQEIWNRALAGEHLPGDLPIFHNKAASLMAFIDCGPDSWRMPWMTPEYIAETKESERPNTFRRIWLNEWVTNESQFLPEGAWAACYSPDVRPLAVGDRRRVVLGADASTSRDLTALVGVEWNQKSNTTDTIYCRVWKPQRGILRLGKPTVDLAETIGAEVMRLHNAGQLDAVICDPFQLHSLIIEWEKAGIKVVELAQNAGRVEADQGLYDAVIGRALRHYNDPTLNDHMRNAIALESSRGYRLAKEKTSQKIDAAVALSMAHYGALDTQKKYGNGVTVIPDPFENEGREYVTVGNGYVFVDEEAPKVHRPGITWRNCRYRNQGCAACVAELEREGYYEAQQAEADQETEGTATDEIEQAREWRQLQAAQDAAKDQKVINQFWKNVSTRMRKDKSNVQK